MDICLKAGWAAAHRKGPHPSKWGAGISLSSCLAWVKTDQKNHAGRGTAPVPIVANKATRWFLQGCRRRSEKSNGTARAPRPSPARALSWEQSSAVRPCGSTSHLPPPTSPALTERHALVSGGGIMARVCKEMVSVVSAQLFLESAQLPPPGSVLFLRDSRGHTASQRWVFATL